MHLKKTPLFYTPNNSHTQRIKKNASNNLYTFYVFPVFLVLFPSDDSYILISFIL